MSPPLVSAHTRTGHSLWFRYFMRTFLPASSTHPLKTGKIPNTGVVMLTLQQGQDKQGHTVYRIDPDSVEEVYGF